MPAATSKVTCPYCGRKVGTTSTGKLYTHKTRANGPRCGRSGGHPQ